MEAAWRQHAPDMVRAACRAGSRPLRRAAGRDEVAPARDPTAAAMEQGRARSLGVKGRQHAPDMVRAACSAGSRPLRRAAGRDGVAPARDSTAAAMEQGRARWLGVHGGSMHRTRSDQRAEPGPGLSVELQGVMDLVVATQRSLEGTQKHSGMGTQQRRVCNLRTTQLKSISMKQIHLQNFHTSST